MDLSMQNDCQQALQPRQDESRLLVYMETFKHLIHSVVSQLNHMHKWRVITISWSNHTYQKGKAHLMVGRSISRNFDFEDFLHPTVLNEPPKSFHFK